MLSVVPPVASEKNTKTRFLAEVGIVNTAELFVQVVATEVMVAHVAPTVQFSPVGEASGAIGERLVPHAGSTLDVVDHAPVRKAGIVSVVPALVSWSSPMRYVCPEPTFWLCFIETRTF
jgi:hypothetical protein